MSARCLISSGVRTLLIMSILTSGMVDDYPRCLECVRKTSCDVGIGNRSIFYWSRCIDVVGHFIYPVYRW
jgi:hypothetical protein